MILVVIREGEHLEPMGDGRFQLVPAGYRGRVLTSEGIPITGATITAYRPHLGLMHAATTTDPNGCFKIPCEGYGAKYRIEFINGSETVTIQGDEIVVETVEMAREKRLRLAEEARGEEAPQPPWWRRIWGLG